MITKKINSLEFYPFDEKEKVFHIELHDEMEGCFSEDLTKEQVIELIEFLNQSLK